MPELSSAPAYAILTAATGGADPQRPQPGGLPQRKPGAGAIGAAAGKKPQPARRVPAPRSGPGSVHGSAPVRNEGVGQPGSGTGEREQQRRDGVAGIVQPPSRAEHGQRRDALGRVDEPDQQRHAGGERPVGADQLSERAADLVAGLRQQRRRCRARRRRPRARPCRAPSATAICQLKPIGSNTSRTANLPMRPPGCYSIALPARRPAATGKLDRNQSTTVSAGMTPPTLRTKIMARCQSRSGRSCRRGQW